MEIVIPHHYRFDLTKNCLDSIPDENTVYLVDDTQVGEAKNYCRYRRFVVWIRHLSVSLPKAINLAAEKVQGKWFLVCDNDVIFDPNAWNQIDLAIIKAKNVGASLILSRYKFVCWLVKTEVFRQLLLDEYFAPAGGEDEDFHLRFCKSGGKWIEFDIPLFHQEGGHHSKGSIYSEGEQTRKFEKRHGFAPHSDEYDKIIRSGFVP